MNDLTTPQRDTMENFADWWLQSSRGVPMRKRYGPRDGLTVAIEAVAQTSGSTDQEDNHAS